jgi:hypothetical protein
MADVAAAIDTFDSYRLGTPGLAEVTRSLNLTYGPDRVSVDWTQRDGAITYYSEGVAYDHSFCSLPGLVILEAAGPGSDFARIGECSPQLAELSVTSWEQCTGREGLTGLQDLETLKIDGAGATGVSVLANIPNLRSLAIFAPLADINELAGFGHLEQIDFNLTEEAFLAIEGGNVNDRNEAIAAMFPYTEVLIGGVPFSG